MVWRLPNENEYSGNFSNYIRQVPEANALDVLKSAKHSTLKLLYSLTLDQWNHRYADGKWTVKEVWVHILDTERIFAYRLLRIGRGDTTPLPGFDQDNYIEPSKANERTIASIISEYEAVRESTICLLENMPEESFDRVGTASNTPISCRAFAFIIAGHERHHVHGLRQNYGINI